MLIGYCRTSTVEQRLDLQIDALKAAGCERIFEEQASGAKADRPILQQALDFMRPGDTLVVWRLDRLARSMKQLVDTIESLRSRDIQFKSLQEGLDATGAAGNLIFHIFGAFAEFERQLIRDRVNAGLTAARARGKKGGRKRVDPNKIEIARGLVARGWTVHAAAAQAGVSQKTLYNYGFAKTQESVEKITH